MLCGTRTNAEVLGADPKISFVDLNINFNDKNESNCHTLEGKVCYQRKVINRSDLSVAVLISNPAKPSAGFEFRLGMGSAVG